jgi:5-methylcytosine-specific restriction protein B
MELSVKLFEQKIEGVPQFVSYFGPVLDVLRDLGGEAKPKQVFEAIAERYEVSEDFLNQTNKNGQPKFNNRVAWARFYLVKAGLLFSPKRGIWALTEEGKATEMSDDLAVDIFRREHSALKADEDEDQAPEGEIVPDGVNYWFVGAAWDEGDQTPRFLEKGIWQNGYDDKFSHLVRQMKQGDRIAIKATYTRKHDVPFDNRERAVSAMRIKAIGTITGNHDDGKTVGVSWEEIDPPREWFFYTYRTTVARARFEDDEMARQLVGFTFENKDQDIERFLKHPYWAEKYAEDIEPLAAIEEQEEADDEQPTEPYGVDDIIADGGFMTRGTLQGMISRIESKKNIILQGAPGTGKTWLAKRLGKALIGKRNPSPGQLRSVQFHPSLSYEDFVRGYRPSSNGLVITDGIFLQVVEVARAQPDIAHVLIIEEINRGNPAQVFGEMLTLLENTKRSRADAIELAYRKQPGERVHVPDNLYIIGTMNVADRSLALVDLALRRRFAFVSLEPVLNDSWAAWCSDRGIDGETIDFIRTQMTALNDDISSDRSLGPQFRIGHSYVTPNETVEDAKAWFKDVIETEIGPLLEEYWFDAPERATEAMARLRNGL